MKVLEEVDPYLRYAFGDFASPRLDTKRTSLAAGPDPACIGTLRRTYRVEDCGTSYDSGDHAFVLSLTCRACGRTAGVRLSFIGPFAMLRVPEAGVVAEDPGHEHGWLRPAYEAITETGYRLLTREELLLASPLRYAGNQAVTLFTALFSDEEDPDVACS